MLQMYTESHKITKLMFNTMNSHCLQYTRQKASVTNVFSMNQSLGLLYFVKQ